MSLFCNCDNERMISSIGSTLRSYNEAHTRLLMLAGEIKTILELNKKTTLITREENENTIKINLILKHLGLEKCEGNELKKIKSPCVK